MPPVVAAAAIGGAAALGGAAISSHSSGSASKASAASADKALSEQKRIFDLQRADRQPYVNASLGALGQAQNLAGQSHYMPLPAQQLGASSQPAALGPAEMAMLPNQSRMAPKAAMASLGQLGQPPMGAPPQGGGEPMGVFRAPDGSTRRLPLRLESELAMKQVKRIE